MIADLDLAKAQAAAAELGTADVAVGIQGDVSDAGRRARRGRRHAARIRRHRPGRQQRRPLDLQAAAGDDRGRLGPAARRDGQGQLPRLPSRGPGDDRPGLGGDIVYICSKNAVFAGPNNIAYSAVKADQAHQVRLLAAELGEYGIRVNGVNPDGVVHGSGIFAGGWGAQRAAVYGVPEDELGAFYAQAHAARSARSSPSPRRQLRSPPSRPTSSATRPGCSSPSTPAWPPRSCVDLVTPSPPSTVARLP